MTAMMSSPAGAHFLHTAPPRSGILLNASPSSSAPNSPKRTSYLLSPFPSISGGGAPHPAPPSSHSSASSSTSSTDDIVSSTSATSAGATLTSPASSHPSRKIRFAPLPEPRREYDEDLLSPGIYPEIDSAQSSPRTAAHALLSPPLSPHVTPATPTRATHYGESHAQGSCSTLGLSLDGMELPDSGQATETNTIVGSDCGTDDTHTQSNSKKKGPRWARLLRIPKPAPLKTSMRSPDESQFSLWRSSSRESTASTSSFRGMLGSLSDSNASTASLGNPLSRRKSAGGAESVPVSPALSFRGGLSLKPVISESGTAASPAVRGSKAHAHTSSAPSSMRRGTRLLNGRVYGSRGSVSAQKNPFANVRDEEPEFVEWGHGGMGSVQGSAGAASAKQYAALQSNKKLSIGHEDSSKGGNAAGDEDDGSGMGWVKRRREQREQRERERKEAEEREAKEKGKGKQEGEVVDTEVKSESADAERAAEKDGKEELERKSSEAPMKEPDSTTKEVPGPVSPADASEVKEMREKEDKPAEGEESKTEEEEEKQKEKEKEYVRTVNVPAPRPHHHHTHSHHSAHSHTRSNPHSLVNSVVPTPTHSTGGTPTVDMHLHSPFGSPSAMAPHNPSPLAVHGSGSTLGVFDNGSPPSSSASSSFEDDGSVVDEKGDDREGDDDEEDEEDEQARKTAIGAGVEKVSRHKD